MRRRNPRRAYDAEGREIRPPTIGQLRAEGDRTAAVHCTAPDCGHGAVISTDRFPADLPFPDIALRLRCSACGSRDVGVMTDMLSLYARLREETGWSAGPADAPATLPVVVGRDVPWPDGWTPDPEDA